MSNINWVTVFLGVLVFGGSLIYLMSPRPRKVRAPAVESKAASGPVKIVPKALKTYTAQEVAKHNLRNDCWIIVDGEVYDVTEYVDEHPGTPPIRPPATLALQRLPQRPLALDIALSPRSFTPDAVCRR